MITNYFKTLGCRRVAPLLFAQSQNADLSPSDNAKLSAHLAHCAACQIEAAQFARIAQDLRQATPAAPVPSADLWSRIQAEITTDTPRVSPLPQQRPSPFAPRLGGLAWAGSAAIAFIGGAWMTYGVGFWGHNGNVSQTQLPAASGTTSTGPANVTLIPPTPAPNSSVASNMGVMAKTTAAKKASGNAMASIAKPTAPSVRPRLETRPDPFAPVSIAPPSKPTLNGTLANRMRPQQTNPTTFGALARLQNRDAQEAERGGARGLYAATATSRSATFDTVGSSARGVTPIPDASAKAAPTIVDATSGTVATTAPNLPEGEPATATIAAIVPPAPVTASMANAAPLGISAAFAYSSVKSTADSDAPTLDDAEPRSIPPAGSGGAFSVGEPTSRMRRQRALFSYGRP